MRIGILLEFFGASIKTIECHFLDHPNVISTTLSVLLRYAECKVYRVGTLLGLHFEA